MYTIYKLTSPSNKVYIGWTKRKLSVRISDHKSFSKNGSLKIHKALRKYPIDQWIIEVLLETEDLNESFNAEKRFILHFNSINDGYNISTGGESGASGAIRSNEYKKYHSSIKKGRKLTDEHRQNISLGMIGRKQSERQKLIASEKLSKTYQITDPSGITFVITNLKKFSSENGLDQGNMCSVAAGRLPHHKGYKVSKVG
jgi:hypothetical protein